MLGKRKKAPLVLAGSILVFSLLISGCGSTDDNNGKVVSPTSVVNTPGPQGVVDTEDNYVAKVGDLKVTQSEFYFFLAQTKSQMENEANPMGTTDLTNFWTTPINGKNPIEIAKEKNLETIKELKILQMEAKKNNIILTDEDKSDLEKGFSDMVKNFGSEQGLSEDMIKSYNINFSQYKVIYTDSALNDKYMKEKMKDFDIPDSEVSKYYAENKSKYDTATVNHVLFMTVDSNTQQPLPDEKQEEAKKKADECLKKVVAGEDIRVLAEKLSEDPGVKENKGEYTFKRNGQMVKEFEDWTFTHNLGDVGIVKTSYGYHVMKKVGESSEEDGKKAAKEDMQRQKMIEKLNPLKSKPEYNVVKNDKVYSEIK